MPPPYHKRRQGLKDRTPRAGVPLPGVGGYDYPRGPFGATGFPGSTPAARKTKTQGPDGRKDTQQTPTQVQAEWTGPEFQNPWPVEVPKPQPSYSQNPFRPGNAPQRGNRFLRGNGSPRQAFARTGEETASEHRMTPVIGLPVGTQPKSVRNTVAQRWKAQPQLWRTYRASPNPGKTGAVLNAPASQHPGTFVYGHPDGKPVPGMQANPGFPPMVTVQSRYYSLEGNQEGYAMNRAEAFTKGGTPAPYPSSYTFYVGNLHLRGGRLTGDRYFGNLSEQQQIGLPTDAYGIARARGPRHRPVRFESPEPWTQNYYDVSGDDSTPPDMVHVSPVAPSRRARSTARPRRG